MRYTIAYITKSGTKSWTEVFAISDGIAYQLADEKAQRYNWRSYFILTSLNTKGKY